MAYFTSIEQIQQNLLIGRLEVLLSLYSVDFVLNHINLGNVQEEIITCSRDVGGILHGRYFTINSSTSSYYILFSVYPNISVDPMLIDKRVIRVTIKQNDPASDVALAVETELKKVGDFSISRLAQLLAIKNLKSGANTPSSSGTTGWPLTQFAVAYAGVNGDANLEYVEVYGKSASPKSTTHVRTITGILTVGKNISVADRRNAGLMERAFLWTQDSFITVGDTISVARPDGRFRRFVIGEPEILGVTTNITTRWRLEAVAD